MIEDSKVTFKLYHFMALGTLFIILPAYNPQNFGALLILMYLVDHVLLFHSTCRYFSRFIKWLVNKPKQKGQYMYGVIIGLYVYQ